MEFVNPEFVAEQLSVTPQTIKNWASNQLIPGAFRVGKFWRFHWPTVQADLIGRLWIEKEDFDMVDIYKRPESPYWQAKINGRRVSTGCTNKREAQEWVRARLRDMTFKQPEAPKGLRFAATSDMYFSVATLKPTTIRGYKICRKSILASLGDFLLDELDEESVKKHIKGRLQQGRHVSARLDLAFLSSLYQWAKHLPDGPKTNPVASLDKRDLGIKAGEKRTNWLTEHQVQALVDSTNSPNIKLMIILATETGMRYSELLGLTESEVDLQRSIVVLGNLGPNRTKNGKSRIVPLTQRAVEALKNTLAIKRETFHAKGFKPLPYVFVNLKRGTKLTTIAKPWKQLTRDLGFADLRFHDLRHTFTSWGIQRGVQEKHLRDLLGHSTSSMTDRYSHLALDHLKMAMEQFQTNTPTNTGAANSGKNSPEKG